MNPWNAPPSQHIPPDKNLVRANVIRQLARGGLFFLGVASTLGCIHILLNSNIFLLFSSPLVLGVLISGLTVFLCARNWFWLKEQPLLAARREQIAIIVLSVLGLAGWALYYFSL